MKDTLSEIKNTSQKINSGVDEEEIIPAIWEIRKQKTSHQQKEKRIQKKMRIV